MIPYLHFILPAPNNGHYLTVFAMEVPVFFWNFHVATIMNKTVSLFWVDLFSFAIGIHRGV